MQEDQKFELEVRGNTSNRIKVKVEDFYIRIDIPSKTFSQIRNIVERAVYPSKKSEYKKAIYKSLRGQEVLIRIFIQNELNAFYEEFSKEKGLKANSEYPYITNYREKEGSIESIFDLFIFVILEKTVESMIGPVVEPIVEELVERFKTRLKIRLEELLQDKANDVVIKVGIKNNAEEEQAEEII